MKLIVTIILLTVNANIILAQVDSAVKNESTLNEREALILENIFQDSVFKFQGKKVAYVTGAAGKNILTKEAFFQAVKERHNCIEYDNCVIRLIKLSEKEKAATKGYDAIILWYTYDKKNERKRIIRNLALKNKT